MTDNNTYDNTEGTTESNQTKKSAQAQQENIKKNQICHYEELIDITRQDYEENVEDLLTKLYEDKERFYTFLILVCKHIVTKKKWRRKKIQQHYYEFITESDEAFGILLMDNNAEKYKSINKYRSHKQLWDRPKYSRCGKRTSPVGKGWSCEAKMKYFKLKYAIENWRDNNEDRMIELAKHVNDKYNMKTSNKKDKGKEEDNEELKRLCEQTMIQSMRKVRVKRKRL